MALSKTSLTRPLAERRCLDGGCCAKENPALLLQGGISMAQSLSVKLLIVAVLLSPLNAIAQSGGGGGGGSAGRASAGAGGTSAATGSPTAGSVGGLAADPGASAGIKGAGAAATNNTGPDPNGVANAARGGNPATPGTNAIDNANSSGSGDGDSANGTVGNAAARGDGGTAATGPSSTGDTAVDAQDRTGDKKIKSIPKGCLPRR